MNLPVSSNLEQKTEVLRVMRDDGTLDPATDPGLALDDVVSFYRAMVRTRRLDERLVTLQRQGRIGFHIGSLGEEATIIGAAAAKIAPTPRASSLV